MGHVEKAERSDNDRAVQFNVSLIACPPTITNGWWKTLIKPRKVKPSARRKIDEKYFSPPELKTLFGVDVLKRTYVSFSEEELVHIDKVLQLLVYIGLNIHRPNSTDKSRSWIDHSVRGIQKLAIIYHRQGRLTNEAKNRYVLTTEEIRCDANYTKLMDLYKGIPEETKLIWQDVLRQFGMDLHYIASDKIAIF